MKPIILTDTITINLITGILSFVGTLFMVLCYYCKLELKNYRFGLIFGLAVSDMMVALNSVFSVFGNQSTGLCNFLGIHRFWSATASLAWTVAIAYHAYELLKTPQTSHSPPVQPHSLRGQQALCWLVPVVTALLPLAFGMPYTWDGEICWLPSNAPFYLKLTTFYGWLVLTWLALILFYAVFLRQHSRPNDEIRIIQGYLVLFLILTIPAAIDRLYEEILEERNKFLQCLHRAAFGILGLANAFCFGVIDPTVKKVICRQQQLLERNRLGVEGGGDIQVDNFFRPESDE